MTCAPQGCQPWARQPENGHAVTASRGEGSRGSSGCGCQPWVLQPVLANVVAVSWSEGSRGLKSGGCQLVVSQPADGLAATVRTS